MTLPERLREIELFAWLGEDEFGSGVVGLKQADVPAGRVPLAATSEAKVTQPYLVAQLCQQSSLYGKKLYLCRFVCAAVVMQTEAGEPL